jgi:oligopeptide transport system permease protein
MKEVLIVARYIVKRLLVSLLTLLILATATFFLMKLIPGNPLMNEKIPPEILERQMSYYGLDKPVMEQYFIYMGKLLSGDLGTSLKYAGRSVTTVIAELFPVSAKLGLTSLVLSYLVGLAFGVLSAQYKDRFPDYALMVIAVVGVAMPSMVVGPLLRYWLGVKLRLLPVTGWGTWQQMVMPAFVMAIGTIAANARNMRASMLGIASQDYIKTARAKGLHPIKVVWRHELRNSLVPIVTGLGPTISNVLMGSFVVEQIFVIPGLGKHFANAVIALDYSMIMGLAIFFGSFLVLMNFLVDLAYGIIDPRIHVS